MNGGSVTSRSACGLDCSFSTRETTSPEPASTRLTAIPVSCVNLSNVVLYHEPRPSALYTVMVFAPAEPVDPVPPHAAVRAVVSAVTTIAVVRRNLRGFMGSLLCSAM